MVTICYMTNREEPHIEWFLDSLHHQGFKEKIPDSQLVVVDFHCLTRPKEFKDLMAKFNVIHVPPKPCVWQGPHRLTKDNWFAASNARNTALCLAPDGHIVYCDDLSVLMPGWVDAVAEASKTGLITLGAYRKVFELTVEPVTGVVTHYKDNPAGYDNRNANSTPASCAGNWLYGCSLCAPVERLIQVGGWPEALCDGMGFEDCIMGIMLGNIGVHFQYHKGMMTWESEEGHHSNVVFKRKDFGNSPDDKSHAVLNTALRSKYHPNYFGDEGIAGLRKRVLAGEPFPVVGIPEHEWYTGTPLKFL